MGNRPCLVLVEWELLLIPQGWPMTEQTESCLFSGSVTEEGRIQREREQERWERLENMKSTPRQNKQKTAINQESFLFFLIFFISFFRSTDAERMNVMPTSGEINHLTCGTAEPCQPYHLPPFPRAHCRYSNTIGLHSNARVATARERHFTVAEGRLWQKKNGGGVWCEMKVYSFVALHFYIRSNKSCELYVWSARLYAGEKDKRKEGREE